MQISNTWSLLDQDERKKDLLMRKKAQQTIDEELWDSTWLRESYPDRFDELYEKWELADDQYDPALFPNRFEEELL